MPKMVTENQLIITYTEKLLDILMFPNDTSLRERIEEQLRALIKQERERVLSIMEQSLRSA